MGLYNKTSQQMLIDLLNASNPSLPIPIDLTQVKFGTVSAVVPTGGAIQDSTVKVTAIASGQYVGNQALTYRRLGVAVLFRSVPIRIDLYSPVATNVSPFNMSALLPYINAKYGLNLQASDITDIAFPAGNTNAVPAIGLAAGTRNSSATLTFTTANQAWSGSILVYWVQSAQDLGVLLSTPNLEHSLTYPGQLDIVGPTVYVPNLDTYYQDFTSFLGAGGTLIPVTFASATIPNSTVSNPFWVSLMAMLASASGNAYTNSSTGSPSDKFNLTGATTSAIIDLTLPANQALYPEADFRYYNKLLVITLAAANTWGAGQMFIHYNG